MLHVIVSVLFAIQGYKIGAHVRSPFASKLVNIPNPYVIGRLCDMSGVTQSSSADPKSKRVTICFMLLIRLSMLFLLLSFQSILIVVEAKKDVLRDDQNILNRSGGSIYGSHGPGCTRKIFVGGLASTVRDHI
ncbi:heterogeneous nuclear ribonucleoprotein 1 [Senna tora]|uniref:Heterogeneous nuclear ribonucleoprotein 1 n=1 Tax=Senna tora TaxID=362788 RepID=A0A834T4P8_9FABA|nr:heterogeneous nuclear ribonucleoprotein 1 [Senna tora]